MSTGCRPQTWRAPQWRRTRWCMPSPRTVGEVGTIIQPPMPAVPGTAAWLFSCDCQSGTTHSNTLLQLTHRPLEEPDVILVVGQVVERKVARADEGIVGRDCGIQQRVDAWRVSWGRLVTKAEGIPASLLHKVNKQNCIAQLSIAAVGPGSTNAMPLQR